jgi:aspartate kinase
MGRMTDYLIRLAERTVKQPHQRELDMLMTAGERVSMALLAMALEERGVRAISFTGSQSGILTTSDHTEARILEIKPFRIEEELKRGKVVIIAGFQGVSREKEITTLGRGGSDTTAIALAAALKADRCDVLTDVDGLFSADPRIVRDAKLLPELSYAEALELASLGAKMHPRSMEVARRYQVPVCIASSANPACPGTRLVERDQGESMENTVVKGIATKDGFTFFKAEAPLEELLPALRKCKVPLRFLSASGGRTSWVCETGKSGNLKKEIPSLETVEVAVVSAVGDGFTASATLVPDFVEALKAAGTQALLLSVSSVSVSAAVPVAKKSDAAKELHARLV